jgi:hypothetical protein
MQQQMQMLQLRLQDADKRGDKMIQARLIMAMERIGRGQALTPYQIVELGLNEQRFALEKKRFDAEFPGGKKPPGTKSAAQPGDSDLASIKTLLDKSSLTPVQRGMLQQGIRAYGAQGAMQHLQSGKLPPGMSKDDAQAMIDFMNGN